MCIHIYINIHVCVNIHIFFYTYVRLYINIYIYIYIYVNICIYTFLAEDSFDGLNTSFDGSKASFRRALWLVFFVEKKHSKRPLSFHTASLSDMKRPPELGARGKRKCGARR